MSKKPQIGHQANCQWVLLPAPCLCWVQVTADIFPPNQRGKAYGIVLLPGVSLQLLLLSDLCLRWIQHSISIRSVRATSICLLVFYHQIRSGSTASIGAAGVKDRCSIH